MKVGRRSLYKDYLKAPTKVFISDLCPLSRLPKILTVAQVTWCYRSVPMCGVRGFQRNVCLMSHIKPVDVSIG